MVELVHAECLQVELEPLEVHYQGRGQRLECTPPLRCNSLSYQDRRKEMSIPAAPMRFRAVAMTERKPQS